MDSSMPFKSKAQRSHLWAVKPEVAKEFHKKTEEMSKKKKKKTPKPRIDNQDK